jgi:tripartite-type tricarboxylate transporter receptor subunit TctC
LRALGVTTARRSDVLPDVPSIVESVAGYDASVWVGVGAPAGTPSEVIERLNREIGAGLADPKIKAQLAEIGTTPMPLTAADYGRFLAAETDKWGTVVRAANIKLQ